MFGKTMIVCMLATSTVQHRETELVWKAMWESKEEIKIEQEETKVVDFSFDSDKVEFKARLKR